MSIEKVRAYLKQYGRDGEIREFSVSSATVELAARALQVAPARIAKTLSFAATGSGEESCILIVAAGDARIDNAAFKAHFGGKAKMLSPDDALRLTGHAIGGVCPFATPPAVRICLDCSLRRFDTVFPACGSSNSAIELTCDELFKYSGASEWVDVCRNWRPEES